MLSRLNCINLTITRDSLNVIKMLRGHSPPSSKIMFMIEESRMIIDGIENVIIQHNYREVNKMADRIIDEVVNI